MTDLTHIYQTGDATWPAAAFTTHGIWTIRKGADGGQRVSAATLNGVTGSPVTTRDVSTAEAAMTALGQSPLFLIRDGETALDDLLHGHGYTIKDPVNLYRCPIETLTKIAPPRMSAFPVWPPLAIITDIWDDAGIGETRQAVMQRAKGPKTAILARCNDRVAGNAYVAIHKDMAMLHALEVVPEQRRQGVAINIMGCAAVWAQHHGATEFSTLCVQQNTAANRLYTSLNMKNVGHYHYRTKVPKRASQV